MSEIAIDVEKQITTPNLPISCDRRTKRHQRKGVIFKIKGETYMLWKLLPWDVLDDKTLCEFTQLLEKNCRRNSWRPYWIPALYLLIQIQFRQKLVSFSRHQYKTPFPSGMDKCKTYRAWRPNMSLDIFHIRQLLEFVVQTLWYTINFAMKQKTDLMEIHILSMQF